MKAEEFEKIIRPLINETQAKFSPLAEKNSLELIQRGVNAGTAITATVCGLANTIGDAVMCYAMLNNLPASQERHAEVVTAVRLAAMQAMKLYVDMDADKRKAANAAKHN
jgi:hypothetical protein